ncbi:MAG: AbrB/MazE/SpoVT family DNA-binding domain-containing protein [Bifidobacteriaceae bacterium]|jgi:AbrB family looped-hinge helix DNA binding protein|nr:AbrB/MazE/SpoVT family DNA-binding domain-containing protein [Bifidobacteriaceae bacterium]
MAPGAAQDHLLGALPTAAPCLPILADKEHVDAGIGIHCPVRGKNLDAEDPRARHRRRPPTDLVRISCLRAATPGPVMSVTPTASRAVGPQLQGGVALRNDWLVATLTITGKGQITLRKEVLRALGARPGDKVDVQVLPGGQVMLRRTRRSGSIEGFIGVVRDKVGRPLSIAEMNQIAADGWAGQR